MGLLEPKRALSHPKDLSKSTPVGTRKTFFPPRYERMFEQKGVLPTVNPGGFLLAASVFGGGSSINWACSLQTPFHVREEWATKYTRNTDPPYLHSFPFTNNLLWCMCMCDQVRVESVHVTGLSEVPGFCMHPHQRDGR